MPPGPHAGNRNRPAYSGQQRFRFPKQIIELFAPRKPIEFKPPPQKRKLRRMSGIASYISKFEDTKADASNGHAGRKDDSERSKFITPAQRRFRSRKCQLDNVQNIMQEGRAAWDPKAEKDGTIKTEDAFKTLFVTNIPFTTLESRVHDEFESFGPVKQVVMPRDREGVPRGYAFVEFERERDLKIAYREANGMRIDGRRVLVDVERGRTVKDWLPNRLDGPNNSCTKKKLPPKRDSRLAP